MPLDQRALDAWRTRVATGRRALGWPVDAPISIRRHAGGVTLAIGAPIDQLFTATELCEWALCATFAEREPGRWAAMLAAQRALPVDEAEAAATSDPSVIDLYLEAPTGSDDALLARLAERAAREARPALRALAAEASRRRVPLLLDDELATLGAGHRSASWSYGSLPVPAAVSWERLAGVPTALVTGSNGKTTTVRLIAAALRAQGARVGWSCTDGVFLDEAPLASGDYSGPAGARSVLRHPEVEAAVLETARGGILRRGLAVARADVAVVTNVSADHFGEYGIDDLDALAAAKLAVAHAVADGGTLVLNADDPRLRAARTTASAVAWFALDADSPALVAARAQGGTTCGVRDGHLVLDRAAGSHDLGTVGSMPIAFDGRAIHNVANLAAAAAASACLGVEPAAIRAAFQRFGSSAGDNLGRLMRFDHGGVAVLLDYAHNVDGLRHLAPVLAAMRERDGRRGRLGLLLGHAGNRRDEDIRAVVAAALALEPDLVVVKEIAGMARGRAPGEVAKLVRDAALGLGHPVDALWVELDEVTAAERALAWARPGDLVLLLVHGRAAREHLLRELGG